MRNLFVLCLCVLVHLLHDYALAQLPSAAGQLRAGAAAVDVTPTKVDSIVAGQFLEVRASSITDRLYAASHRAGQWSNADGDRGRRYLHDATELITKARQLAHQKCGMPVQNITSPPHTLIQLLQLWDAWARASIASMPLYYRSRSLMPSAMPTTACNRRALVGRRLMTGNIRTIDVGFANPRR